MANYIPDNDAEFNNWQEQFSTYVEENIAALGITAEQFNQLDAYSTTWDTKYAAHLSAQDAAHAATEGKDDARAPLESYARSLAGLIQANPDVTDEQREAAGLPVHKTSRTPVSVPTTRPVANVETAQRLQHTIQFRDEDATGKARPAGVSGCEIWAKVGGEAPTDASELTFLGVDTRTPYLASYTMAQGGQTVYYMLRWVNTRGEQGPWSETVQATIQG